MNLTTDGILYDSLIMTDEYIVNESNPSNIVTGIFEFLPDTINIFGQYIEKPRLYGIILSNRKEEKLSNFIGDSIETIKDYVEYEYEAKLQFVYKDDKESIVQYIKSNSGKEINIKKSLFSEFEGGKTVTIDSVEYAVVIPDYDTLETPLQIRNHFDISVKLKARELYEI